MRGKITSTLTCVCKGNHCGVHSRFTAALVFSLCMCAERDLNVAVCSYACFCHLKFCSDVSCSVCPQLVTPTPAFNMSHLDSFLSELCCLYTFWLENLMPGYTWKEQLHSKDWNNEPVFKYFLQCFSKVAGSEVGKPHCRYIQYTATTKAHLLSFSQKIKMRLCRKN